MNYQNLIGKKTNYGTISYIRESGDKRFGWVGVEEDNGSEFFILLNTLYEIPKKTISLNKEEIKNLMSDVDKGVGWSDTSYKIIRFIGGDPTDGV